MATSTLTARFDCPLLRVTDIICLHPRAGHCCERGGERTHFILVRRSGFRYHINGKVVVGHSTSTLLYRAGDTYRDIYPF